MKKSKISTVFCDIHCHLLPGVDDGVASEGKALELVRKATLMGCKTIIFTPHYSERKGYTMPQEDVRAVFDSFADKCRAENINAELLLGRELDMSQDVLTLLGTTEPMTLGNTKLVLCEFIPVILWEDLYDYVRRLANLGLIPVIAHIERYPCLTERPKRLTELISLGARLQMNISSVDGHHKKFCKWAIKKRFVTFLATDTHDSYPTAEEMERKLSLVRRWSDEQYLERIVKTNISNYIYDPHEDEGVI